MNGVINVMFPERGLHTVILFVTSRCNAKCGTCFYWDELNRKGDLTFEEIRTLSETMPTFHDLLLSGGEPSLREELPEIVKLFYTRNGIRKIYFPTNGLKPALIASMVDGILCANPGLELYLNVSVDGLAETHDRVRGVPGNFERSLETIRAAEGLKPKHAARLQLNVTSVICADNYRELPALARYFLENASLDYHYFQIIRGAPLDDTLKEDIPHAELRALYGELARVGEVYASRQSEGRGFVRGWIRKTLFASTMSFHHRTQFENYTAGAEWKMPCTAGETSIVIDYDGRVRACELREPLGNLRDWGCDFGEFWASSVRGTEVRSIARDKCFCTHVCFIHDSMRFSSRAKFVELPKSYLKRLNWA